MKLPELAQAMALPAMPWGNEEALAGISAVL